MRETGGGMDFIRRSKNQLVWFDLYFQAGKMDAREGCYMYTDGLDQHAFIASAYLLIDWHGLRNNTGGAAA